MREFPPVLFPKNCANPLLVIVAEAAVLFPEKPRAGRLGNPQQSGICSAAELFTITAFPALLLPVNDIPLWGVLTIVAWFAVLKLSNSTSKLFVIIAVPAELEFKKLTKPELIICAPPAVLPFVKCNA